MNKHFYRFLIIVKALLKPFFPVKVYGTRQLPQRKTIVVGNHLSGFDPVMYYAYNKQHMSFLYKDELGNSKFLRKVFNACDFIPVKRGEVDMNATRKCLRLLHDDKILVLFPEGTRNVNVDCMQEFKTGAALFALKTKSPIRPFYIWDKTKIFRKNYIIVGEEFQLSEFYDQPITKELLTNATAVIKDKVEQLRLELNKINYNKGIKHRKRTPKERAKIQEYNDRQRSLAKSITNTTIEGDE